MIVNVGGFGHSGNTALLDFLIDSQEFVMPGDGYSESCFYRSRWGLAGIVSSIVNGIPLESRNIQALLEGDSKYFSFYEGDKPPKDDFIRMRRIYHKLGDDYLSLVSKFLNEYEKILSKSDNKEILESTYQIFNDFLFSVMELTFIKENRVNVESAHFLIRNDPAAANIDLLDFSIIDFQLVTLRNPIDSAAEWIPFYGHELDENGTKKFIRQYKVKSQKFIESVRSLKNRHKLFLVEFEKLVESSTYREALLSKLSLGSSEHCRFNPEDSIKNIGIGERLPANLRELIAKGTMIEYEKLRGLAK